MNADFYFVETRDGDPRLQTIVPVRTIYVLPRQSLFEAMLSNDKVLDLIRQLLTKVEQPQYATQAGAQQKRNGEEVAATD